MLISRLFILFVSVLLPICRAQESDCNAVCESKIGEAVAAARQELEARLNDKASELDGLKRVLDAVISRRDELEKGTSNYVKEIHNVKREAEETKARASEADAALNKVKEEMKISQERLLSVMEEMKKKDDRIRELKSVGILDLLMRQAEPWINTIVTLVKGKKAKEQDL